MLQRSTFIPRPDMVNVLKANMILIESYVY